MLYKSRNLSVAVTHLWTIPTSLDEWPASSTQCNWLFGYTLCKSQAERTGQTTSYRPWTIMPGISFILTSGAKVLH
jgi:hypothetical protein